MATMRCRMPTNSPGPDRYFPGAAWQAHLQKCAEAVENQDVPATDLPVSAPAPTVSAPSLPSERSEPSAPARGVTVTTIDQSCMETLALVRLIVTHPDVWPGFAHDFMGTPEEFVPPWLGQREYLIAKKNKQVIGLFMLTNFQYGIWVGHWAFFPWAKGRDVKIAADIGIKMMFERPDCWTIVGLTPECNKAALWSSRRVGFSRVGALPSATRIGGKWFDLIVSQVTKPL